MTPLHASDLDAASRSDLIARAEGLGIDKADVLTRAELVDEIVKRTVADPIERRLARGLLGVARDLVARVVERGLHLPDAAALIRGLHQVTLTPVTPPIATVTLAEIYAGQGHRARALTVLDEVLAKEPEHAAARALRERVAALPDTTPPAIATSKPPPIAEPDRDRDRDTLPPEADVSPPLVPTDLPLATWRVDASDEVATESARPTEIAPPFLDTGQVVLVPFDATSVLARWELGATALDEARARAEGGELILRIVAVTPGWDGPTTEIRDVQIALPVGDWWVCDLPAGAVIRGAIGWRGDRGFDPLAVALDMAAPGERDAVSEDDSALQGSGDAVERRAGIEDRARRQVGQGRPAEGRTSSSWRALALAPWEAPHEAERAVSAERAASVETR